MVQAAERVLVVGANGQIGSELTVALAEKFGSDNVIASDLEARTDLGVQFEPLDILDSQHLVKLVQQHRITQLYQLAATLSATGEQAPRKAWRLNIDGLLNVLELARQQPLRIFWPSSIAVFGPSTPRINTPQTTLVEPSTIYGVSKLAGERLVAYYHARYQIDARSLRYPGVISYKTAPGGGTTDYAIEIFQAAKRGQGYSCYLAADATLPMIYMPDAVRATLELMDADAAQLSVRTSYNLAGLSFSPTELAAAIKRRVPAFEIHYAPDFRQDIAASWPQSIDDAQARADWNWQACFDLDQMVDEMLANVPMSWAAA